MRAGPVPADILAPYLGPEGNRWHAPTRTIWGLRVELWAGDREATRGATEPQGPPLQGRQKMREHLPPQTEKGIGSPPGEEQRPSEGAWGRPHRPHPTWADWSSLGEVRGLEGQMKDKAQQPLRLPQTCPPCVCEGFRGPPTALLWAGDVIPVNPKASTFSPSACLRARCSGARTIWLGAQGPGPCVFGGAPQPMDCCCVTRAPVPLQSAVLVGLGGCDKVPPSGLEQQKFIFLSWRPEVFHPGAGQAGPCVASLRGLQVVPSPRVCAGLCR